MTLPPRLATVAAFALLVPAAGTAAELKDELKLDWSKPSKVWSAFSAYGYLPGRSVIPEPGGFRFRLPANVAGVTQTGAYSYFTLSGDCEVSCAFELVNVPAPREGYGSGVGLAFDAGDEVGRGTIQRVEKNAKESGYVVQTSPGTKGAKIKEEYRFVSSSAKRGRMGLRRVKKGLIFLASDDPTVPLAEVERLPFTEGTVRAVRFFADPGGSPTMVDVRLREIEVRAEEVTGGIPRREVSRRGWWWLTAVVPAAALGLVVWRWRAGRRRADE